MQIQGINGSTTPTQGGLWIMASKKSGTGSTAFTSSELVMQFVNGGSTLAQWYGAGLNMLGGLSVGYSGVPTSGRLTIGDANFYAEIDGSPNPHIQFDTADYMAYDRAANALRVFVGGAASVNFAASQTQVPDGSASLPGLTFFNATSTGLYRTGASMGLVANGAELIRLLSTGDVQWLVAQTALGGGAAPTVGTIGGGGPATAAQNSWLRIKDSTGAAMFIPCWK